MLKSSDYETVRPAIRVGDGFAFCGKGLMPSTMIRYWTRPSFWKFWKLSAVSHWATVLEVQEDRRRVLLVESTTLNGKSGVQITEASKRVADYDGRIWWLPLSPASMQKLDKERFTKFMLAQAGKSYDKVLIGHMLFDRFSLVHSDEDWESFICSELGAAGGKAGGLLPLNLNSSDITPQRMCEYALWGPSYYQLKGSRLEIAGFNSRKLPTSF